VDILGKYDVLLKQGRWLLSIKDTFVFLEILYNNEGISGRNIYYDISLMHRDNVIYEETLWRRMI